MNRADGTGLEDHGASGTQAEHARMERLEADLAEHERKTREHRDAENAGQVEPAKGWVGPKPEQPT